MRSRIRGGCVCALLVSMGLCLAADPAVELTAPEAAARLAAAPAALGTFAAQLRGLEKEWQTTLGALADKSYKEITSEETDRIESLMFRYLVCRESLWDMLTFLSDYDRRFATEEEQTRAFAAAFHAAALLSRHTAWLVLNAMDEKAIVRKLNEAHYRYDIPAGTFDMLFYALTSPKNLAELDAARSSFASAATVSDSTLSRIMDADPSFSAQLAQTAWLWMQADGLTKDILKRRSIVLPDVANRLRQNELMEQARKVHRKIAADLYVAQGLLFNTVSDFKRPMTRHLTFTREQVAAVRAALQPGDLIMTFSAGYMSNVFLPGHFKHGITYVGTVEQRRNAGLDATALANVPAGKRAKAAKDLEFARLASGEEVDLIEAVAEGVIFNSTEVIMHNHINRMLVLRPRVSREDRVGALVNTFLLLGCQYDFNFDFVDASYQCCTEVIYRSFDRRGGMEFSLIPRAGVRTLAADDIVNYYLDTNPGAFEFVLLAEEDPGRKTGEARVLSGDEGRKRLVALMKDTSDREPAFTMPTFKPAFPDLLPSKAK